MVFRGEMTTARTRPERPKSLHNFTLPSSLKWGSQRHLTCTKIESASAGDHRLRRRSPPTKVPGSSSSSSSPFRFGESDHRRRNGDNDGIIQHRRRSSFKSVDDGGEEEEEEGIEEFRVKIMSDLKTVRDKITRSMYALGGEKRDEEEEEGRRTDGGSGQEEKEVSPVKPWNLRKRRAAACKEPTEEEMVVIPPPPPPSRNDSARVVKERAETEMVTKRPKFSVKLSKKEIEEDFMAVLGRRPPRRPKKRPRTVQKKLDSLHPAFYLTEVTLDDYKVEETKR
ncbi:hypothetical protein HA466_0086420 [Hirschfeldia incana]|nr:hypothetical protein HA466_0086420 [Hirschfeldia incana]